MIQAQVITIDGPSGTGKGTLAVLLAKRLGWHVLDSGAIYRAVAFAILKQQIDIHDAAALQQLLANTDIQLVTDTPTEPARIYCNSEDITRAIREEAVGMMASTSSALPLVRQAVLKTQRDFQIPPGLVADGRDMGTVVFPNAVLKFYLDADPTVRINRRFKELLGKGSETDLEEVKKSLLMRDQQDAHRAIAPLIPAPDAHIIDTTELTIDQVFAKVMAYVHRFVL